MDLIASFPVEDTETKELFEEWKRLGVSIDIETEKRFVGGAEIVSVVIALTPLVTFLIGRYFDLLKSQKVEFEYRGGKVLVEGYNTEKFVELLLHASKKD